MSTIKFIPYDTHSKYASVLQHRFDEVGRTINNYRILAPWEMRHRLVVAVMVMASWVTLLLLTKNWLSQVLGKRQGVQCQGVLPEQPEMVTMMSEWFTETILIYSNQTGYRDWLSCVNDKTTNAAQHLPVGGTGVEHNELGVSLCEWVFCMFGMCVRRLYYPELSRSGYTVFNKFTTAELYGTTPNWTFNAKHWITCVIP